jgi:hypothetical protein
MKCSPSDDGEVKDFVWPQPAIDDVRPVEGFRDGTDGKDDAGKPKVVHVSRPPLRDWLRFGSCARRNGRVLVM